MTATLATPLSQIELTPGSAIRMTGVTGESYIARVALSPGCLNDFSVARWAIPSGIRYYPAMCFR